MFWQSVRGRAMVLAYFELALPPFQPEQPSVANWQTSAWMRRAPDLGGLAAAGGVDDHYD